jgi:hypothetical protein
MVGNRSVHALALALALAVSACATPTPYQPYRPERLGGVHGGYSERLLAPGRFIVRFHGNELTSRDRVEKYLLYRAAEVALRNGAGWFTIVDRHTEHDVSTVVRPDPFPAPYIGSIYGYWRPHWRYYRQGYGWDVWHPEFGGPFWADRLDVQTVESFEASAEILLHRAQPSATDQRVFDARRVMADLRPMIVFPKQR